MDTHRCKRCFAHINPHVLIPIYQRYCHKCVDYIAAHGIIEPPVPVAEHKNRGRHVIKVRFPNSKYQGEGD